MKTKEEVFANAFKDKTYKIVGLPDFQMPIVHIRKEQVPQLDHSVDVFEYATRILVDRQKKIDEQLLKAINEVMETHKITDYYGIDETRLLEIIEEARAFEMIKNTFSLRQPLIEACDKTSFPLSVMPQRKRFVKEMLLK